MSAEKVICMWCGTMIYYNDIDEDYYLDYDSEGNSVVHYTIMCPYCDKNTETSQS